MARASCVHVRAIWRYAKQLGICQAILPYCGVFVFSDGLPIGVLNSWQSQSHAIKVGSLKLREEVLKCLQLVGSMEYFNLAFAVPFPSIEVGKLYCASRTIKPRNEFPSSRGQGWMLQHHARAERS